jgi:CMP-N,N'-diacetyllegionaminic acid synthase
MIAGKSVVAIIAARGGSKGFPGKNVHHLAGKPLIAWSIHAAQQSCYLDRVVVSSDDDTILQIARSYGCSDVVKRPAILATDTAPIEEALIHVLDSLGDGYDLLVLLQPTSPLRIAADIDGALERCVSQSAPACISVSVPPKSPFWMCTMDSRGRLVRLLDVEPLARRRQDLPTTYALNGAVYVADVSWFRENRRFLTDETVGYEMPPERSPDVDTKLDLRYVEAIIAAQDGANP